MNNRPQEDDARFLALLQRWASGAFTREDEETIRSLTDDDAFRREAWEGFWALPAEAHQAALERLQQRLAPAVPERRAPVPLWRKGAAAAVLLLLAGALYWWWTDTPLAPEQATVTTPEALSLSTPTPEEGQEAYVPYDRSAPAAPSSPPQALAPRRDAAAQGAGSMPETLSGAQAPAVTLAQDEVAEQALMPMEAEKAAEERKEPVATAPPGQPVPQMKPGVALTDTHLRSPHRSERMERLTKTNQERELAELPSLKPVEGWSAFMAQYRSAALSLSGGAPKPDSLLVVLRVGSDSMATMETTQPPLQRVQRQPLEQFLQKYRWTPANSRGTVKLPLRQ